MCGITGAINYNSGFNATTLQRMCTALIHRGPDDSGTYLNPEKRVALGHRRLSIIDLSQGHQPMANENGSIHIVFNGEIYNYKDLRKELSNNHAFSTSSDTEVLIHLYEEFGTEMFLKINGMFAFAIWDDSKSRLLIARDRLGIKPVYYTVLKDTFIFASEIKALFHYGNIEKTVDVNSLYHFLKLRCVPSPHTMFKNIYKIKPGYFLEVGLEGIISEQAYWRLEDAYEGPILGNYENRIDTLLDSSVKLRMTSDVPIGSFLSGGIDSSLINSYMTNHVSAPVNTFTVGFNDNRYNEFDYAKHMSDILKTNHREKILDHKIFLKFFPLMIHHFDDPVADGAIIPMYLLSEMARENNVKVMLSGEGSDELFAGYSSYLKYLSLFKIAKWANFFPNSVVNRTIKQLMKGNIKKEALENLSEFIISDRQYPGHSSSHITGLLSLFAEPHQRQINVDMLKEYADIPKRLEVSFLDRMLYMDLKVRIPDDLLARLDKLTMASSVEGRVPFLDHRLVEVALGIPDKLKINKGERKYILKKVADKYLPNNIVYRQKKGFPVPIDGWIKDDLKDLFKEVLLSEKTDFFDKSVIEKMIQENEAGLTDHSLILWRLFYFIVWHGHWISDKNILEAPAEELVS